MTKAKHHPHPDSPRTRRANIPVSEAEILRLQALARHRGVDVADVVRLDTGVADDAAVHRGDAVGGTTRRA
jgi:hypothetical protein